MLLFVLLRQLRRILSTVKRERIVVFENFRLFLSMTTRSRGSRDSRGQKLRDASLAIVRFMRPSKTLAATTRQVHNELWHGESGNGAAYLGFDVENLLQRGTKMLDLWGHVALVNVVLCIGKT